MVNQLATFGAGCFWGVEVAFRNVPGVKDAQVGYLGGTLKNPTYRDVCTGRTGHAEVVQVEYDPTVVTYDRLLDVFWENHDPTTLNRQGPDVGTQYRSAVFPTSPEQDSQVRAAIARAEADWPAPIVTTIEPLADWWPAETYHQDYWEGEGQRNPYCLAVIPPKLRKLRKSFAARAKSEAAASA